MKYALIDNERIEASRGIKGAVCQGCLQPVVAKCGSIKVHHWAHQSERKCDSWWEPETEWHRSWKNNFPAEWQERIMYDEVTGEKHIADTHTPHGLVIEFQHSAIHPDEQVARERFYKNMVWVVDAKPKDFERFFSVKDRFRAVNQSLFQVDYPKTCLPLSWVNSSIPVIFDFRSKEMQGLSDRFKNLYCLIPTRFLYSPAVSETAIIAQISRDLFINLVRNGEWATLISTVTQNILQVNRENQDRLAMQHHHSTNRVFTQPAERRYSTGTYKTYRKGRRF